MTRTLFAVLLLFTAACNAPDNKTAATDSATVKTTAHDYGVKATYSTDFSVGDHKHGDMILSMWKDFDANKLDNSKGNWADTVTAMFPGYVATVPKDSLLATAKAERAAMDSVTTELDAIVPLKASNKNETVVCVWGRETSYTKGKKAVRDLSEVWGINEAGKITWIKQYTAAVPE